MTESVLLCTYGDGSRPRSQGTGSGALSIEVPLSGASFLKPSLSGLPRLLIGGFPKNKNGPLAGEGWGEERGPAGAGNGSLSRSSPAVALEGSLKTSHLSVSICTMGSGLPVLALIPRRTEKLQPALPQRKWSEMITCSFSELPSFSSWYFFSLLNSQDFNSWQVKPPPHASVGSSKWV